MNTDLNTALRDTTILIVGHGSREESGNQEIRDFVAQWRARQPGWRIEVCFIEFASPSLHDGLGAAAQGARRVLVLPLILNAAGHVKMEIPEAIEHARALPAGEFLYGPHLTACDPILAILKRQLRRAMAALDMPDPTTTGVVLLGRGSSDRAPTATWPRWPAGCRRPVTTSWWTWPSPASPFRAWSGWCSARPASA
jgi:sirohydrochlorin cobaltochelatase